MRFTKLWRKQLLKKLPREWCWKKKNFIFVSLSILIHQFHFFTSNKTDFSCKVEQQHNVRTFLDTAIILQKTNQNKLSIPILIQYNVKRITRKKNYRPKWKNTLKTKIINALLQLKESFIISYSENLTHFRFYIKLIICGV